MKREEKGFWCLLEDALVKPLGWRSAEYSGIVILPFELTRI